MYIILYINIIHITRRYSHIHTCIRIYPHTTSLIYVYISAQKQVTAHSVYVVLPLCKKGVHSMCQKGGYPLFEYRSQFRRNTVSKHLHVLCVCRGFYTQKFRYEKKLWDKRNLDEKKWDRQAGRPRTHHIRKNMHIFVRVWQKWILERQSNHLTNCSQYTGVPVWLFVDQEGYTFTCKFDFSLTTHPNITWYTDFLLTMCQWRSTKSQRQHPFAKRVRQYCQCVFFASLVGCDWQTNNWRIPAKKLRNCVWFLVLSHQRQRVCYHSLLGHLSLHFSLLS